MWEDSARVAKLLLMDREVGDGVEATEIWQKWAAHLAQNRQKFAATLILTAVGAWHKAAEMLVQQLMPDAAALLLRSAEDMALYAPKDPAQLHFKVILFHYYFIFFYFIILLLFY